MVLSVLLRFGTIYSIHLEAFITANIMKGLESMKKQKKIVVVWEKDLTDEQRKNYEKDHPGYRLSFAMMHPNFPIYISLVAILLLVTAMITELILLKL